MWQQQDSDIDAAIELADQHDRIMHSPLMENKNTCKGFVLLLLLLHAAMLRRAKHTIDLIVMLVGYAAVYHALHCSHASASNQTY
jgi:hypothetical protein